jgi:hypothetical protein
VIKGGNRFINARSKAKPSDGVLWKFLREDTNGAITAFGKAAVDTHVSAWLFMTDAVEKGF